MSRPYDQREWRRTVRTLLDDPAACCWRCGSTNDLTGGHIHPGGGNGIDNARAECRYHNSQDGGRRGQAQRRARVHPPQQGGNFATSPPPVA
jgi:5-methylcytosine-specific restriction endonuclease McrA